mgnify:CR=1 FL=1
MSDSNQTPITNKYTPFGEGNMMLKKQVSDSADFEIVSKTNKKS